jgi:hypothetical protein
MAESIAQIEEVELDGAFVNMFSATVSLAERTIEVVEKTGPLYPLISSLLALCCIVGAILMLMLNKLGFHLYASAQVVMLLVPLMFGLMDFSSTFFFASTVLGILLTALFIWLYARELKIINK